MFSSTEVGVGWSEMVEAIVETEDRWNMVAGTTKEREEGKKEEIIKLGRERTEKESVLNGEGKWGSTKSSSKVSRSEVGGML